MNLFIAIVGLPAEMRDAFMREFLEERFAKYRIEIVKSYTTAERRTDEDYRYHVFVSAREFREREGRDEFFHVERRNGALNGFRWNDIADIIADGHCIALFADLPDDRLAILKRLVGDVTVIRPLADGPVPAGAENAPRVTHFRKPDGDGKPN